jgi:putrescine transport system ATP-binding protein
VAFGLVQDGMGKAETAARVDEMLGLVQMGKLARRKPHQLSGGQQQRVALARSLAKSPKLLLLDEPMGALDKKLRSQMQIELVNIVERLGVTCVMVTHDQEEAMTMAHRIAVMDSGKIRQIGTPDEIYEQPNCRYTAEFIGSVNLFEGKVEEDEKDYVTIRTPGLDSPIYIGHGITGYDGMSVAFAIRPEKVSISKEEPSQKYNKAKGVIEEIAYFGSHSVYHVRLASGAKVLCNFVNMKRWASEDFTWNDAVWLSWDDNSGVVLTS